MGRRFIYTKIMNQPISTSATYPGTGSNTGSGLYSWSSPYRITANDNVFASVNVGSKGTTTYLRGTNFGFSIPTGVTINGIEVSIGRYAVPTNRIIDSDVRLVKGGTIVGVNKAKTTTSWPGSEGVATYGSSTDLWDETWSPSDINASDFGVVLSATNTTYSSASASVDYIRITVTYTAE